MIEVRNLVKKYGDHVAVDGLSFQLEPGRTAAFWDLTVRENRRQ